MEMAGRVLSGKPPRGRARIVDADPDAEDGRGVVTWTDDLATARKFASPFLAIEFWKQQSTVRPTREDGKPNRPLTAFTVVLEQLGRPMGASDESVG